MTEQLKFIVSELGRPPFNKTYNLISFDGLNGQQLLQTLSDVLQMVNDKAKVDIKTEAPDETAFRIFNVLHFFRYKPVENDDVSTFRQMVVEGEKEAIYPILAWVFPRQEDLKKRAYLSRFLIRVDVPPDFLQDIEVEQLYQQMEQLIEEFKEVHKQSETIRTDGATSEEIRIDIKSMEDEREQLRKRIDRLKKKVDHAPQRDKMLEMAKTLRLATEKESEFQMQKAEQRNGLLNAQQKLQRMTQQIKDLENEAKNLDPTDVIQRLREENQSHRYLSEEKIPKEIDTKRKVVQELQKVASQPALDEADITNLKKRIEGTQDEINHLAEQKNEQFDPGQDNLAVYRQQANMVQRKKDTSAEKLQDAMQELKQVEEEIEEKMKVSRDADGNEIITGSQFKAYLSKLRQKSTHYKKCRQEIQEMKSESGVLVRTEEIMRSQAEKLGKSIQPGGGEIEESPREDDEMNSDIGALYDKSEDDLRRMAKELENTLEDKRAALAPIIQELRPRREKYEEMTEENVTRKSQYEGLAASLESGFSRLEQEVKSLRNETNTNESKQIQLDVEQRIITALIKRAENEASGGGKKIRDVLNQKIKESENASKHLREEQKNLRDLQEDNSKQIKMWRDFQKIMECKKRCWEQQHGSRRNQERFHSASSRSGSARRGT